MAKSVFKFHFVRWPVAIVGLCLLALTACGEREAVPADDATPITAAPALEVPVAVAAAASDEYGPFGAPITGVALWAHPSLPYEGLVFAASAEGLVSYNIEDGAEIARDDSFSADGVAIAYRGGAQDGEAVMVSRDASAGAFRFYSIDNETRLPALRPTMAAIDVGAEAYCLGATGDGGVQLVTVSGKAFTRYDLQFTAAGVGARRGGAGAAPDLLAACAIDDGDGSLYLASERGAIYHRGADGAVSAFSATNVRAPAGLAAAINRHKESGDDQGQIALLDGANGHVHLFDREDGHGLGVVRIGASFDVEAVNAATAIGVGYGNFGAIYRNGALALATNGDAPSIRLISWNGVLNALGQPEATTADPRALQPEEAGDGDGDGDGDLIIDIEIIEP